MTTKPKASRFRVGNKLAHNAPSADERRDAEANTRADIENENLTDRQFRMALRVAQKHGITPSDAIDAVLQLREAGIDPFQKVNVRDLIEGAEAQAPAAPAQANQPRSNITPHPQAGPLPGQVPSQIPGQVPGQIPGQIPSQMARQPQPANNVTQMPQAGPQPVHPNVGMPPQSAPSPFGTAAGPAPEGSGAPQGVPLGQLGGLPGKIVLSGPPQAPEEEPQPTKKDPAEREAEIRALQAEIAERRRKKMRMTLYRLAAFVVAPTVICAVYFFFIATSMFATNAAFLILKADGDGGSMGGAMQATQFATSQDAIAVQLYLQSKEAMTRLDNDLGFKEHFSDPGIDFVQRLAPSASIEDTYRVYQRHIQVGYDPTEGVMRMEVSAADPILAKSFAETLIGYAQERVDQLSLKKRKDQVVEAERALNRAKNERTEAQTRLIDLQQSFKVLDPASRAAAIQDQMSEVEISIQVLELELQALLDNARPNLAKVDGTRADIRRGKDLLLQLQSELSEKKNGGYSVAEMTTMLRIAETDLSTYDAILQRQEELYTQAIMEATSQARYLTTSVEPVVPDDPAYPRKFQNTLMAFLIFAGVYMILAITGTILREQMSG